jgi:hypothetical protein
VEPDLPTGPWHGGLRLGGAYNLGYYKGDDFTAFLQGLTGPQGEVRVAPPQTELETPWFLEFELQRGVLLPNPEDQYPPEEKMRGDQWRARLQRRPVSTEPTSHFTNLGWGAGQFTSFYRWDPEALKARRRFATGPTWTIADRSTTGNFTEATTTDFSFFVGEAYASELCYTKEFIRGLGTAGYRGRATLLMTTDRHFSLGAAVEIFFGFQF